MDLSNKLTRTEFFVELFTINQKFTFDQMIIAMESGKNHMDIGTKSEQYAKKIMYSFIDLTSSLDTLEEIPIFFSIDKVPIFYITKGISEIQYYKYHLENHYIKITSILDYTAHFINEVYRLGIPEKKCNVFTIAENLNIKGTKVGIVFEKFSSHFQNLKRKRNIIIHKGNFESEEIKSIDNTIMSSTFINNEQILYDWFNERRQTEIAKVMAMLTENNSFVGEYLIELSNSLIIPFFDNYNYLKTIDSPAGT